MAVHGSKISKGSLELTIPLLYLAHLYAHTTMRRSTVFLVSACALIFATADVTYAEDDILQRIVEHAVVAIFSYDSSGQVIGFGSGFFVHTGHVATNWHVVKHGDRTEVVSNSGESSSVRVVTYYPDIDFALLELAEPATSARYLRMHPGRPALGSRVYAIGGPLGLMFSVSEGIVSSISREIAGQSFLQFTSPVSPGSSGGPVVNRDGEVIGVVTWQLSQGQNLNFAIPASQLAPLLIDMPTVADLRALDAAEQDRVIYQLTGQGQIDLAQQGQQRGLGEHLHYAGFELRTINLAQAPQVPDDAAIVAIVRPRTDISQGEAEKLSAYLNNGGNLFAAMELAAGELPNVAWVLERFGIGIPTAVLVDPDRDFNNGQPLELWPQLSETSITAPLVEANYRVFTPLARPILELGTELAGVAIDPLLVTSAESFFRTNMEIPSPSITAEDVLGPHPVAIRAEREDLTSGAESSRLVVIGDVDFISLTDQVHGNLAFLLNCISWLAEQ